MEVKRPMHYHQAMTKTLRVHFDGKVFVPDEPVDLPVGEPLEIVLRKVAGKGRMRSFSEVAAWIESLPPVEDDDSPGDRAAQHDHYLYGTPKQPTTDVAPHPPAATAPPVARSIASSTMPGVRRFGSTSGSPLGSLGNTR